MRSSSPLLIEQKEEEQSPPNGASAAWLWIPFLPCFAHIALPHVDMVATIEHPLEPRP